MVEDNDDTLIQKIITAMVGGDVPDLLFIDKSWVPGFLKEEVLEPVAAGDSRTWLSQVNLRSRSSPIPERRLPERECFHADQ